MGNLIVELFMKANTLHDIIVVSTVLMKVVNSGADVTALSDDVIRDVTPVTSSSADDGDAANNNSDASNITENRKKHREEHNT